MALKYLVYDDEGHINRIYSDEKIAMAAYDDALQEICTMVSENIYFSDYIFVSCGEELTDTSCWDIIESETVNQTYLKNEVAPWIRKNLYLLEDDLNKFIAKAENSLPDWGSTTVLRILKEIGGRCFRIFIIC